MLKGREEQEKGSSFPSFPSVNPHLAIMLPYHISAALHPLASPGPWADHRAGTSLVLNKEENTADGHG